VFINAGSIGTTNLDASTAWSISAGALVDGTYSITAKATDSEGNIGTLSSAITFEVDTTAPAAPTITLPASGSRTSDNTPTFSGSAEANSTVTVLVNAVVLDTTIADGSGAWSYTPVAPLSDATHSITATAKDIANNTSVSSSAVAITIDTTAPAAPIISSPANGTRTTDTTPTLSGTAEANSTVSLLVNGTVSTNVAANNAGNWTTTLPELTSGTYSVTVKCTDAVGHNSPLSSVLTLIIYEDLCPNDPNKEVPGSCGCGVVEDTNDDDNDGIINCKDTTSEVVTFYKISGTISLENLNTDPLVGALVRADGQEATTDNKGAYLLENISSGTHNVTASLDGYHFSPEGGIDTEVSNKDVSNIDFSAKPKISNPAYAMWNGFLGMVNVLEMMNLGDEEMTVALTVYSIGGSDSTITKTWSIASMTQRDIIINDLEGFEADTYGMVKVKCSHDKFDGRVSLYYPDTSGARDAQYGFAYSEALRNANLGKSAAMYNSYHPGNNIFDTKNTVYNWLTIANLDTENTHYFTISRYEMAGNLVTKTRVGVPPRGRRDIDGGHVAPGPNNVGTNIIVPDDNTAPYLANMVRYAEGSNFDNFDYAFTLPATNGFSRTIYAPISNSDHAENYIEVANILDEEIEVKLRFLDDEGFLIVEITNTFGPLAQKHFPILGLLDEGVSGYVAITPNKAASVISQSVFYHRDYTNRSIQTAYASPAREPFGAKIYTTYNLYLGMTNLMRIMNISEADATVSYTLGDGEQEIDTKGSAGNNPAKSISLSTREARSFEIDDAKINRSSGGYGIVTIESSKAGAIASELVRIRQLINGKYEFAIDTPAR
jgi:hypothetical protein